MKIRELFTLNALVSLTNEESDFLNRNGNTIDLNSLSEREFRIAENLLYKDVLCKISDTQLMVNENEKLRH